MKDNAKEADKRKAQLISHLKYVKKVINKQIKLCKLII